MAVICPTITAYDNHEYRRQIEVVQSFAKRIHIDLMDGQFAPHTSVDLQHIWWPKDTIADIHLMYQWPMNYIEQLVKLKPNLVIIPYEAEVDHLAFARNLQDQGIRAGLSLQQETQAEKTSDILSSFDHVLIFSGNLGEHGGKADLDLLDKVPQLREFSYDIEISWDGGINDQNVKQLADGSIEVLNTGSFIQNSENPAAAYKKLLEII